MIEMLRDYRQSGENWRYIRCHCSPRVVPAFKRSGGHCRNEKVFTSFLRAVLISAPLWYLIYIIRKEMGTGLSHGVMVTIRMVVVVVVTMRATVMTTKQAFRVRIHGSFLRQKSAFLWIASLCGERADENWFSGPQNPTIFAYVQLALI